MNLVPQQLYNSALHAWLVKIWLKQAMKELRQEIKSYVRKNSISKTPPTDS